MSDLPLTPEDVADIVAILDGSGYDRMEVATRRFTLHLARAGEGWTQRWVPTAAVPDPVAGTGPGIDANPEADPDPATVTAPLPGTFYRAPQPGAAPFVQPGDAVTAETVVGIVETMKLMNPVHAGRAGTVAAILADDGQVVAAGTPLLRLADGA